jgi:acyl carrier protein
VSVPGADIEQFIVSELAQGRGITALDPADNLLTKGIVDSHGVMELVGFLEERYGISVEDADLTPENFESLNSIQGFVERKRDGQI